MRQATAGSEQWAEGVASAPDRTTKPMLKREFRVVWQIAKGHARQTRIYQREGSARKFFEGLPDSYRMKRFESRVVEDWELRIIRQLGKTISYEK